MIDHDDYTEQYPTNEIPICIGINSTNKPNYNKFILNALLILMLQFALTNIIVFSAYYYLNYLNYLNYFNNIKLLKYLFCISLFIFIINFILIACYRYSNKFILYLLFLIFTITSSILISTSILYYLPNIVLISLCGIFIYILISIIYVLICYIYNYNICKLTITIISLTFTILLLIILQLLIFNYDYLYFFISFLIVILFNLFLMYDLQILYKHNNEIIFKNPIYPVISIYLDIIIIFLTLLGCMNLAKNGLCNI